MKISVSEAKGRLVELLRRAQAGDEVILTRHGRPAVRLVPVTIKPIGPERRRMLDAARQAGRRKATSGPNAARSQDFLYNDGDAPRWYRLILSH